MTRFLVQLLLSVTVSVGAILGLGPDRKAELREALKETGASLRQTADVALKNIGEAANQTRIDFSSRTNAGVSAGSGENAKVKVKNSLDINTGSGVSFPGTFLSDLALTGNTASESQTGAKADAAGLDVRLRNKTRSILNLDLGPGE